MKLELARQGFFSLVTFSTTPCHWNCSKLMTFCCLSGDWKSTSNRFSAWAVFSTPFRLSLLWVFVLRFKWISASSKLFSLLFWKCVQLLAFFFYYFCPKTGIFLILKFIMHFVTSSNFNGFYLVCFWNITLFFMTGQTSKTAFIRFYLVNILLMFISCVNICK